MILIKVLAASLALAIAIEVAHAQTSTATSKPRATVQPSDARTGAARPYEPRAGGRRIVDPDPFIEGEILRHRNSGWPD